MLATITIAAAIWLALSFPLAVLVGSALRWGSK